LRISERADKFAARLRPPAKVDTRSEDEKWASFAVKYSSPNDYLRKARRRKDNS